MPSHEFKKTKNASLLPENHSSQSLILEVWEHLYGKPDEPIAYLCISSGLRPSGEEGKVNKGRYPDEDFATQYFRWPEESEEAARYALEESNKGRNVYHCAHLLGERRRSKENAICVSSLWADGDEAEIPEGIPRPTLIVETSPGRYQYYWRLDRRVSLGRAEDLNKRLTYFVGADRGGWSLTKLLRVPGTINHDYAGVYAEPVVVRIKGERPDGG